MLALSTTRCGVVRLFTNRSKRLRSPRRNRILRTGSPMRGIYRMYLLCIRFPLHYTRMTESPTRSHRADHAGPGGTSGMRMTKAPSMVSLPDSLVDCPNPVKIAV